MEWFKFHTIWGSGLQELSDVEAGRFIKSLCSYAETGEIEARSGNERLLLSIALKQMKQDAEYSARISSIRAEARRGKGLSSKNAESNDNNSYQMKTKKSIDNNCSNKNKNKNKESEEESDINICANAQNYEPKAIEFSAKSAKLTPDDHDFWKFAKENAELAESFYRTSGIYPVKSQFGRWINDLRDLSEAGISPEQLRKTIVYMQSENIPLSAPGSCLKTAQWLKSRGSVPVKQTKQKPAYNAFEQLAMQMNGIPEPSWDVEL